MFGVAHGDLRTVTGRNVALLRQEAGLDPVSSSSFYVRVKLMEGAAKVPEVDKWRMDYLARLLTERGEASYTVEGGVVVRLTALIDSLCVN